MKNTRNLLLLLIINCSFFIFNCNAQWIKQNSGTRVNLKSVYFVNDTLGWAVGEKGTILYTTNAGTTWTFQNSGTTANLLSVTKGWAFGDTATMLGYENSKWVKTQLSVTLPPQFSWCSSQFIKNQVWLAGGCGSPFDTINYQGYIAFNNGFWQGGALPYSAKGVSTYDLKHIFMILDYYEDFYIFHTTNGLSSPLHNQPIDGQTSITRKLNSISVLDKNHGWCVGDSGYIYSYEKDSLWVSQPLSFKNNYYSVYFPDTNHGWVVGDSGRIEKYLNGTWSKDTNIVNYKLSSVYFTDKYHGWIVGDSGTIISINNSPPLLLNVTPANPIICGRPDSIRFKINAKGAAPLSFQWIKNGKDISGATNIIYMTKDSGTYACIVTNLYGTSTSNSSVLTTYSTLQIPVLTLSKSKDSIRSSFNIGNLWYYNNAIIKGAKDPFYLPKVNGLYYAIVKIDSCISDTSNKIDYKYADINELKMGNGEWKIQIYPNPVNSLLMISYQLSEFSFVNMKLFDLTGNEIATVVNEQKAKGIYKIYYDAENLKSGVYFCKIQTGQYSETTKIIVVR